MKKCKKCNSYDLKLKSCKETEVYSEVFEIECILRIAVCQVNSVFKEIKEIKEGITMTRELQEKIKNMIEREEKEESKEEWWKSNNGDENV